jgi:serine protease Do
MIPRVTVQIPQTGAPLVTLLATLLVAVARTSNGEKPPMPRSADAMMKRSSACLPSSRPAAPSAGAPGLPALVPLALLPTAFLHTVLLSLALLIFPLGHATTALAQPASFAPIVREQRDKVVHISTNLKPSPPGEAGRGRPFGFPGSGRGMGSGFILTSDGYIVTNYHVVESASQIQVTLGDERKFAARVVGVDAQTDLALIKVEATGLPRVEFGNSAAVQVGDWVIAIGNPLGLTHSVTAGIISAKGRNIFNEKNLAYGEFLQTDAAINPGNSGGPLFDLQGKVVGVNSAVISKGQGIGFAVPSNLVVKVVTQLREHGRLIRGWLGVTIQEVAAPDSEFPGLPKNTRGVVIREILPGSPAADGGLRPGDLVTHFAGKPLKLITQLQKRVALTPPESRVAIRGLRRTDESGPWKALNLTVRIGENPRSASAGESTYLARLGLVTMNIPEHLRKRIRLDREAGVLVESVESGSVADGLGLRAGDIILEAGRKPVGSRRALEAALSESTSQRISLVVRRKNKVLFIVVSRADLGR